MRRLRHLELHTGHLSLHADSPELDAAGAAGCLRVGHAIVRTGDDLTGLAGRLRATDWDAVEIDVLEHRGRLLVAHDSGDLAHPVPLPFDEALAALSAAVPARTGLIVDLKAVGYERAVVDVLRELELTDRTLVSTMLPASLAALRAVAPSVRRGLSVPRARRNYLAHPVTRPVALALMAGVSRMLPPRARATIGSGLAHAIMAHWAVVTPALVAAVHGAGGELYAWTVDDPVRLRRVQALGVTGVISNEATLFWPVGSEAGGSR